MAKYAVTVCALVGATVYARIYGPDIVSSIRDSIVSWTRKQATAQPDVTLLRSSFCELEVLTVPVTSSHTHPASAATRSAAASFMKQFAHVVGRPAYQHQKSAADVRHGFQGSRSYYWAKDLEVEDETYRPSPDALICLKDVDYYMDMEVFLAKTFQPVLLYTFNPSTAGTTRSDFSYSFDKDGVVTTEINGGSKYSHPVWQYGTDTLKCTWRVFGFPLKTTMFHVNYKQVTEDRQLVLLTPIATWEGLSALTAELISAGRLRRLKPDVQWCGDIRFLRLKIRGPKPMVSTGIVGTPVSATIPVEDDMALSLCVADSKSTALLVPAIKKLVTDEREAFILKRFYLHGKRTCLPGVIQVEEGVRRYQFGKKDLTAKPAMRAFMQPLLHLGYVPDKTKDNDKVMIAKRVTEQQAKVANVTRPSVWLADKLAEFTDFFCGDTLLTPTTFEEVALRQNRPSQQMVLTKASIATDKHDAESFSKSEAYAEVKDPRNITIIAPQDKVHYATYIYPLADHAKQFPWYAFGKSPLEISERVVFIAAHAQYLGEADASRMDGTVNALVRLYVEKPILTRLFRHNRAEITKLHETQYNLSSRTKLGVKYNTGFSRCSGSMETSVFNTILTAVCAYVTYRSMGLTPQEAWDSLGVFGGDDGLVVDINSAAYHRSAKALGLTLKHKNYARGELGVNFLSRFFGPYVWYGDPTSICDVPRQLAKFHLTVGDPTNPAEKLAEKVRSFLLTDANTPVIGDYCRKVADVYSVRPGEGETWWSQFEADVQFPNEKADWMDVLVEEKLSKLGFDLLTFHEWLNKSHSIGSLMSAPCFAEPKPPAKEELQA